jgi:prevent-host-death family protein
MIRKATRRRTPRSGPASITATEAAKNFGRLVDRVREHGATYVIERHGRPIAQVGPVPPAARPKTLRGLVEYLRTAPKLDAEVLRYVEEGIEIANRPEVPKNSWER